MTKNSSWLKKYTELKHAENILTTCSLHLGNPRCWPDKNESELIKIYETAKDATRVRASCLTGAADRFHFWTVFGNKQKGICFWFDRKSLIADIKKENGLIAQNVRYKKPTTLSEIPFSKRAQYSDEKEFRVLTRQQTGHVPTSFSFAPNTLRRIYLNAWLSNKKLENEKDRIKELLRGNLSHVEIFQSRVVRKKAWIEHAQQIAVKNGAFTQA